MLYAVFHNSHTLANPISVVTSVFRYLDTGLRCKHSKPPWREKYLYIAPTCFSMMPKCAKRFTVHGLVDRKTEVTTLYVTFASPASFVDNVRNHEVQTNKNI